MDNNPQVPPMPPMPAQTPAPQGESLPPIAPQSTAPQTVLTEEKKSSKKLIIFFIAGIIVIGILVVGSYWFLSKNQANSDKTTTGNTPVPVVQQQVSIESLESDLNAVNVATDDSDLTTVEQDLQGL